jgi:hypothetical protein
LVNLLNILQIIHETHVHRDLSLDNVFSLTEVCKIIETVSHNLQEKVLLNDWGCSVRVGQIEGFSGCQYLVCSGGVVCGVWCVVCGVWCVVCGVGCGVWWHGV